MSKVTGGVAGKGEWALFFFGDSPLNFPVDVYARCRKVGSNREITELYLKAKPGHRIDSRFMRDFNVESIRRFANFMLDHQLESHANESALEIKPLLQELFQSGQKRVRTKPVQIDATVEVPPGRTRDQQFYEEFADLYKRLGVVDSRPASTIAKFNELPLPTVHGWIKEARSRGLLEPARERIKRK